MDRGTPLDTLPSPDSVTGKLSTETENRPREVEDSAEREDIARVGATLSNYRPEAAHSFSRLCHPAWGAIRSRRNLCKVGHPMGKRRFRVLEILAATQR
jgi:hypothetical protein